MKRLDLKVGFQCNNRCLFCVQGDRRYHCPNKSGAEIKKILSRKVKDHNSIVFTGGEPTIRKELIDWVKCAKKLGYQTIQIQSNGRMFSYKDYCRVLISAGANEFSPAIHGSNAKVHDSLTQAPGSFKQTVQGIKNLRELDQHIVTNSVITRINYKDLPNLARLLVSLRVNQFQFAFMHINGIIAKSPPLVEKIVPRYHEVIPYMKKGVDIGVQAGLRVMVEAVPYCFMQGYERYISEQYIPLASVIDDKLEVDDYTSYRKTAGKSKGPQCQNCQYNKICEGPWREYPEIFGWSEFQPVQDLSRSVLLIMTGFLCNNDCVMCSVKPKGLNHQPRRTEKIITDLERGRKEGYQRIEFTGGEPTMRVDLISLINKAKKLDYKEIALGTNSRTLSSLKFLKSLQKAGLNRITTTLYGPDARTHDNVTRMPGSFNLTVQGIKNSLALGITISVNTVVFSLTAKNLAKTGDFLASLGVRYWTLLDLIPDGYATEKYKLFSLDPSKLKLTIKKIEPIISKFKVVNIIDFPYCFFSYNLLTKPNCSFINAKLRKEFVNQVGYQPKRFKEKDRVFFDLHKTRTKKCQTCAYCNECGGAWIPYLSLYGDSFIKPFLKKIKK